MKFVKRKTKRKSTFVVTCPDMTFAGGIHFKITHYLLLIASITLVLTADCAALFGIEA